MAEAKKEHVIEDYDLSNITSEKIFSLFWGKEANLVSVHIDWEGLTGDLDGEINLLQKNDPKLKWAELSDLNSMMTTESDSLILEDTEWGGEVLGLRLKLNGITGGILNVVVISKDK